MGIVPTSKEDDTLTSLSSTSDRVVVATDQILSTLMTCTKSVYSWDLILTKTGNKIVLDKRNGGVIDFLSVNENADSNTGSVAGQVPLENEGVNGRGALSVEATRIQSKVRAAVVDRHTNVEFEQPPTSFVKKLEELKHIDGGIKKINTVSNSELADVEEGYTYRKIWMDTFSLLARCTVHAAIHTSGSEVNPILENAIDTPYPGNETQLVNIYALHEWEKQSLGYRKALDGQRGALLATELKQNWTRIAKWVCECHLAGVNMMKLGFVTRNTWSNRNEHTLLGVVTERVETLKGKMGLETEKGMGIIKGLCDLWFGVKVVKKVKDTAEIETEEELKGNAGEEELVEVQEGGLEDGVYCLVKDAYKGILTIYKVQESELQ
jgi:translation initiation factor 3 subunit D